MTKEEAKQLLPIIQALAKGKTIQQTDGYDWYDLDDPDFMANSNSYRIKPESKYRPFANAEECWQEMQKHQPFGWLKDKDGDKTFIGCINSDNTIFMCNSEILYLKEVFEDFTFIDGTPFGIKKEE